ncbi:MAG: hypothetical protein ACXWWU_00960 [Candidatus Limnocylindria bacterium]
MRHRSRADLWIWLVLAGLWAVWAAPADAATCGVDPVTISRADVVFVGRPTAVSSVGDQATFAVDEVWTAANLGPTAAVIGDVGQWNARDVENQSPYVVIAAVVDGSLEVHNECDVSHPSLSQPWEPFFDAVRPATAHPPSVLDTVSDPPVQLILALAVIALVVIVSALAFKRTSVRPEDRRPR